MKNLLENVIRTFLFEARGVAKIKSLSRKDLSDAMSGGAKWAYGVLLKNVINDPKDKLSVFNAVYAVTLANSAADEDNLIAVGPNSKFATTGNYTYVIKDKIGEETVEKDGVKTVQNVYNKFSEKDRRYMAVILIYPGDITKLQVPIDEPIKNISNDKGTPEKGKTEKDIKVPVAPIKMVGKVPIMWESEYLKKLEEAKKANPTNDELKKIDTDSISDASTIIDTMQDAAKDIKQQVQSATGNYPPPTDASAWVDNKYTWYTDKGTGKFEQGPDVYRYGGNADKYFLVFPEDSSTNGLAWKSIDALVFNAKHANYKDIYYKAMWAERNDLKWLRDLKLPGDVPSTPAAPTPVTNPTTAQIDMAREYRLWANSTPELKSKYGKTSTYDLDATSNKPWNSNFEKSYAVGKTEFDQRTPGTVTPPPPPKWVPKKMEEVKVKPGTLQLYYRKSDGTFTPKLVTTAGNNDTVIVQDIVNGYYYVSIEGKMYWIKSNTVTKK